ETDRILTPDGCFRGDADIAGSCGFDLFDPVSRRSRSIRPRFVPEFPLERNDRHRAARHGHWSPRLAIKQAGRQPARTKCLTDLARSKAQEPDRLCVARRADPPHHVHGRGSQPPDTPRRSRGRERDYAASEYPLPALRSKTHWREPPNRQGRHRQWHRERLTRASREAARAAQAATTAKKR